jgi:hypothetical protein
MHGETSLSILRRVIGSTDGSLDVAVAQSFLQLGFTDADQDRIQYLAERNTEDLLTSDERREYEGYVLVGEFLALLQAKAHASLRNHPSAV